MSDISLNGTTYSGTPVSTSNPFRPDADGYEIRDVKIGVLKKAANGALTWMHFGIKREFTIRWRLANETTRAALRTLHELTTTFTFVDPLGVSYTVITTEADYKEASALNTIGNAVYWSLEITLRQV